MTGTVTVWDCLIILLSPACMFYLPHSCLNSSRPSASCSKQPHLPVHCEPQILYLYQILLSQIPVESTSACGFCHLCAHLWCPSIFHIGLRIQNRSRSGAGNSGFSAQSTHLWTSQEEPLKGGLSLLPMSAMTQKPKDLNFSRP